MELVLAQNIPVSKYVEKSRFLVVVFVCLFVWGEGKTSTNPLILKQKRKPMENFSIK